DGQALVADFGIALAVSAAGAGRMTETGLSLGTPHYMSPEQATADRELDARSDIYSLACVTYEMLGGEPPHIGNNAQAIIARILTETPRPLRSLRQSVPLHTEAALAKALEKLPADRFTDARNFADALSDPASADRFTTVASKGNTSGTRTAFNFGKIHFALGAVVFFFIGLLTNGLLRPEPVADSVSVRFAHIPDSDHSMFSQCCGAPLAISRDGSIIAYEGTDPSGPENRIWVRQIDELDATVLPETEGARNLFFSFDGEWIGFVSLPSNTLMKVPVGGGAPVVIADLSGPLRGATWTEQDLIIFSTLQSGGLYQVSAQGSPPQLLVGPDSSVHSSYRNPHYVAESNSVLFVAHLVGEDLRSSRVGLLDLESHETSFVATGLAPFFTRSGHLVTVSNSGVVSAQPLDPWTGEIAGPQFRLAEDVTVRPDGTSEYAVSHSGVLVQNDWGAVNAFDVLPLFTREGAFQGVPVSLAEADHIDDPKFSPNGEEIAVIVGSPDGGQAHDLYIFDPRDGSARRLTSHGNVNAFDWTDRGDEIIYVSNLEVLRLATDGSGAETSLTEIDGEVWTQVSSYGTWIARNSPSQGGMSDISLVNFESEEGEQQYRATRFDEHSPAISPDGKWLAFVSDDTGHDEVYVSTFPEISRVHVISQGGGLDPVWSSDGRTLYYRSGDMKLNAVTVSEGDSFIIGAREVLFDSPVFGSASGEYDVHPSDQLFVWTAADGNGGSDGRVLVVTNAIGGTQ
ncbi:MAG: hypothetical protein OEZ54_10100, partial [Gemmatimonadota bacterium]|nr:hypothetical protein [Gemmatimonadota bacterium]